MRSKARPLGVTMMCAWCAGLMVETVARTLSLSLRTTPSQEWIFALTLPLAVTGGLYIVALAVALAGMWKLRNWARKLFLGLLSVYYGLLFLGGIALWGPLIGLSMRAPGQGWVTAVVIEASLGLAFGWSYLNRGTVKQWFSADRRPEH